MTGLDRRLQLLETVSSPGACEECGLAPGAPFTDYSVDWQDSEDAPPFAPEWCSTCGRQVVYVVGWRDIGPDEVGEGVS
ncbi:MAG: hypothetical protein M3P49_04085 [Actinomycetota bacterium]|nr:hypothetical protein [Actinomycetota bacterium]